VANEFIVQGATICTDHHGFLSLTDMWRVAGETYTKRPAVWTKLLYTKELIDALGSGLNQVHQMMVAARATVEWKFRASLS